MKVLISLLRPCPACVEKTTKEKVKSKARINAGKKKATGLQKWLQACKAAKEELKKQGYEVTNLPKKNTYYMTVTKEIYAKEQSLTPR